MRSDSIRRLAWVALAGVGVIVLSCTRFGEEPGPRSPSSSEVDPVPIRRSGTFTENAGQLGREDILFHGSISGMQVGFAVGGVYLHGRLARDDQARIEGDGGLRGVLVRMAFRGANPVIPVPSERAGHATNFLLGPEEAHWQRALQSFGVITYPDIYDGVDLSFRVDPKGLKYDLRIAPGANLSKVVFGIEGAEGIALDSRGRLAIRTAIGDVIDAAPTARAGEREIPAAYEILGPHAFRFRCDAWQGEEPLVIDPLIWASFAGGTFGDVVGAMAVDSQGAVYVTGTTASPDFPDTTGPYDDALVGANSTDAFVLKLEPGGAQAWTTFFGGSHDEHARGIGVDGARNVTISGFTYSDDLPPGPPFMYRDHYAGETPATFTGDTYVAMLSQDGAYIYYRTYLGPSFVVAPFIPGGPLAVDSLGNAYVVTATASSDFFAGAGAPGYDQSYNGGSDVAIVKLNSFGTGIYYGTYLGGTAYDFPTSVHLGKGGTLYVSGFTDSWQDFPTLNPVQDEGQGGRDFFVTRLSEDGTSLLFSTYLGGVYEEDESALAVDACGEVYVAGTTASPDFPGVESGYQSDYGGANRDGVVFRLDSSGHPLVAATYLGGNLNDGAYGIDLDGAGNVYVTGRTNSPNFETVNPLFSKGSLEDAFFVRLSPMLDQLVDSTYIGGSNNDAGRALQVRGHEQIFVAGETESADFPEIIPPVNNYDVFVMKLGLDPHVSPHGLGWWKHFICRWPLDSLLVGGQSYFKPELIRLLKLPSRGDASVILAHQLIPAKLNVAMGVDDGAVAPVIAEADRLVGVSGRRLPLDLHPPEPGAQAMLALKETLEAFNEGR